MLDHQNQHDFDWVDPELELDNAHSGGGFTGLFETNNNPLTASVLHNKAILVAGGGGGSGANATGGGLGGGNVGGDGLAATTPDKVVSL